MTITADTATDITVRVAPPAAVAVANAAGVDVPMLINLVMLTYLSVLLAHKLWTIFKDWREGRLRIVPPNSCDLCKSDTNNQGQK